MAVPTRFHIHDGVGAAEAGDVLIAMWNAPASLDRMNFLLDISERAMAESEGTFLLLQVVLPSADPPERETWAVARVRMSVQRSRVRRFVTFPVGDDVWRMVVRSVMRMVAVLVKDARDLVVSASLDHALTELLRARSAETPTESELRAAIDELARRLAFPPEALRSARSGM